VAAHRRGLDTTHGADHEGSRLDSASRRISAHPLKQKVWILTEPGVSETKRKVKFYALTKDGRKQLDVEIEKWQTANAVVARFLEMPS
jgi:hypothetical protein